MLTGQQPAPHATAADAARSVDLVERYGLVAAGIGWARGVLCQAGLLDTLMTLPTELRLQLPDGTRVLGVHASPGADDGQGIEPGPPDEQLGALPAGCAADIVIGGHTHRAADRTIAGIRALNPGSTKISGAPRRGRLASPRPRPPRPGDPPDAPGRESASVGVEHRTVLFDVHAVVRDLRARLHPNAEFLEAILTGQRPQRV